MSPVHADLVRFLGSARWFSGKGRPFRISSVRRVGSLGAPGDRVQAVVDLVTVSWEDNGPDETWQLPLSLRPRPERRLEHAFVGTWDDMHVYDAIHDREAMALWLEAFIKDEPSPSGLTFHRLETDQLDPAAPAAALTLEQSNSSVAYAEDALLKVFRKVMPGPNPDIEVHDALSRAGSDHVAALYGWVEVTDGGETFQLAMLQQFLRTAADGWALARASARNLFAEADLHAHEVGGDFAAEAARLGIALAETHAALAEHFPTSRLDTAGVSRLVEEMAERLDDAVTAVPGLAAYADGLRPLREALTALDGLPVQRIHGDLHLGQTLRTVKGWKLVDFEGEPLRPLPDRLQPEPVWRDVAGMLRSFDYVVSVVQRELDTSSEAPALAEQREHRAAEWVARNRAAFLTAYAGRPLTDLENALVAAFEADKAVYECAYEARNRPEWVGIPLAAVARLVAN